MASSPILDFQVLLTPISESFSTGINLKTQDSSGLYHRLKDARTAARAQERQAIDGQTIDKKLWNEVYNSSLQILQTLSKDLEVCAWLIEAMVRKFGYVGCRDGYHLINELINTFWDNLYPQPDEDGLSTRVAALTGLNGEGKEGTLIMPLSNIFLTEAKSGDALVLWQYTQATIIERITDVNKKNDQLQKFGISLDSFKRAVNESSHEFLTNLLEDLQGAIEEYNRFSNLIMEKCQQESPPISNIKMKLEEALDAVAFLTKDILKKEENVKDFSEISINTDSSVESKILAVDSTITRQEAFQRLEKLSDFFRRTEPHSPLSYILARAIRWGQLSLPDLMVELINDDKIRAEYCVLAGIDSQPQPQP